MASSTMRLGRRSLFLVQPLVRPLSSTGTSNKNFVSRIFDRKIEPATAAHSKQLASANYVYELQFHAVQPGRMEEYLEKAEKMLPKISEDPDIPRRLMASWSVDVGRQDQAMHLWLYESGYQGVHEAKDRLAKDEAYLAYIRSQANILRERHNQILMEFSFWGSLDALRSCEPGGIFEMRSYQLQPGTLMEWGQEWSRGIVKRKTAQDKPVGGWFSQIGDLYMVHHLWSYRDLQHRKEVRESAWLQPGWDEVVARTVPLIRWMESSILRPTHFSPLQ